MAVIVGAEKGISTLSTINTRPTLYSLRNTEDCVVRNRTYTKKSDVEIWVRFMKQEIKRETNIKYNRNNYNNANFNRHPLVA